ncbi:MAG TPA: transglycosylase SLT domain-containing protein, partial [Burkholderiales bacterium]|nr:transglycosylase SLT domain-containing protein [Burkholderiales bacterium]
TAESLYCRAARAGYADAQFRLGWSYANGRGTTRDDGLAAALFAMAAAQGHEYAGRLLAYLPQSDGSRLPDCMRAEPVTVALGGDRSDGVGEDAAASDAAGVASRLKVPPRILEIVHRLAPKYAVDTDLALAVIAVESDFNAFAVSPRNALGIMQLVPDTAERFGVKAVFSPAENIRGGLAYLRWLLSFFRGDVRLVLAAYNAGERAVERYRGIPPYPETRDYVRKVSAIYPRTTHPYEPDVVAPSTITSVRRSARP